MSDGHEAFEIARHSRRLVEELLAARLALTAERDKLRAEVERLRVAARYCEDVEATPEIQRETMLYDTLVERDQMRAEVEALRGFADEIVSCNYLDGGDIQDIGVKHGLLRPEHRDKECGDGCACSEHGFPTTCVRKTAILDAAMAAKEVDP